MIQNVDLFLDWRPVVHSDLKRFLAAARSPRLRTMREFAEAEIIIPTGEYRNRPFRCHRQPSIALLFELMDDPHWLEIAVTGPSQSGKTLLFFVIPLLYHLFEVGETVVCGVPNMEIAADKWERDILPVLSKTRYASMMPRVGAGSRGGFPDLITFTNGASLKWMTGGGSDKTRAAFNARVAIFTEVDQLDVISEGSVEGTKVKQIEARTRHYGSRKRIYKECTVSTQTGHIWQRYQKGTTTKLMLPCPYCSDLVSNEREHLKGWDKAESDEEAEELAHFVCPSCDHAWTEDERVEANKHAQIMHRGQQVVEGKIEGDRARTRTLGMRYSAVNNMFVTTSDLGRDEWNAREEIDEDNAEREQCQFVWAVPYEIPGLDTDMPDEKRIMRQVRSGYQRGIIPADTLWLTIGVDMGKYSGHYWLNCYLPDLTIHVPEYGVFEVCTQEFGIERAMLQSLREFRDRCSEGWICEDGSHVRPSQVWIDSGWQKEQRGQIDSIYEFIKESDPNLYRPSKGYGASQKLGRYRMPKKRAGQIKAVGDNFHIVELKSKGVLLVELNADYFKTYVHRRFGTDERDEAGVRNPGHITMYSSINPNEHIRPAKHLTAEHLEEIYTAGVGIEMIWKRHSKSNHYFDCAALACAAGSFCGFSPKGLQQYDTGDDEQPPRSGLRTPDGQPFVMTQR